MCARGKGGCAYKERFRLFCFFAEGGVREKAVALGREGLQHDESAGAKNQAAKHDVEQGLEV